MELYRFSLANTTGGYKVVQYTSGAEDYEAATLGTFKAVPVKRGELSFSFDTNKLIIKMPMDVWPATDYKLLNPFGVITLTMYNEAESVMFAGTIGSCGFKLDKNEATLSITSIQEVLTSSVPIKVYSPSCPYELYGRRCGVNTADFVVPLDSADVFINGNTVVSMWLSDKPSGYYDGGWVQTDDERITISRHIDSTLILMYPLRSDIVNGIQVFPGCDKSISTCKTVFDNDTQFGGFPFVPQKNPVMEEF